MRERIVAFDLLKILAILFVMYNHTEFYGFRFEGSYSSIYGGGNCV